MPQIRTPNATGLPAHIPCVCMRIWSCQRCPASAGGAHGHRSPRVFCEKRPMHMAPRPVSSCKSSVMLSSRALAHSWGHTVAGSEVSEVLRDVGVALKQPKDALVMRLARQSHCTLCLWLRERGRLKHKATLQPHSNSQCWIPTVTA